MPNHILDRSDIMRRGQIGHDTERGKCEPLGYPTFRLLGSASGIAIACVGEYYSMTEALRVQFPPESDGTNLGVEMMAMRIIVVIALGLGHVLLHAAANPNSGAIGRTIHRLRVIPMLAIMIAMAVFMLSAGIQATGGDGVAGFAGWALGVMWAALFSLSFLASNALAKKLLPALRTVLSGLSQRAKVARIARDLREADECCASLTTLERDIHAREETDVLQRRAAAEMATAIGRVAAETNGLRAPLAALGDAARDETRVVGTPDIPLVVLEQMQAYLNGLDFSFFLNILKSKEA